jgi:hypothetical protein
LVCTNPKQLSTDIDMTKGSCSSHLFKVFTVPANYFVPSANPWFILLFLSSNATTRSLILYQQLSLILIFDCCAQPEPTTLKPAKPWNPWKLKLHQRDNSIAPWQHGFEWNDRQGGFANRRCHLSVYSWLGNGDGFSQANLE